MNEAKSPFSLRSYGAFVRSANSNKEALKGSWKEILAGAFDLTPDQQAALDKAPEASSREVQKQFDAAYAFVGKGGKLRTRISTRSDGTHGLKFLMDEEAMTADASGGHSLVCCGADCKDWGVWCKDPPQ